MHAVTSRDDADGSTDVRRQALETSPADAPTDGQGLLFDHLPEEDDGAFGQRSIDLLRSEWFATFAAPEARRSLHGPVPFETVLEYLDAAFDIEPNLGPEASDVMIRRISENLEDLSLAIACIDGDAAAWTTLENEIGPLLARMCELRVDETTALLHSSRFLRTVRERTLAVGDELEDGIIDDGTPCLQEYLGLHPLRSFLGGPLFAMLQDLIRDGLVEGTARPENRCDDARRLRLVD